MSVEIEGMKALIQKLQRAYDDETLIHLQDKALKKGAKYFVSVLKLEFELFRDTGASIEEVSITDPYFIHGNIRMIKVYWEGPQHRRSIIHINEWGSVINPNPRGKGAIARTMRITKEPYRQIVKNDLEGGLR